MSDRTSPTFTLCIFTWNEIESIRAIMPKVDRSIFEQILVIDAHSSDGTVEWCKAQGYEIFTQSSNGIRQAYQEAVPHIRGDYMIAFSPDGNSLPEKLPELVAKLREGYDMVIVSRYLAGAKSEDDDILTGFGNWMFTHLVNFLFGAHYTDVMVMYRGFRTRMIRDLYLNDPRAPMLFWPERMFFAKMGIEHLLSVRAVRAQLRVGEIPGDEPKRLGGKRKMKIVRWGSACMLQFLAERFIPSKRYRRAVGQK